MKIAVNYTRTIFKHRAGGWRDRDRAHAMRWQVANEGTRLVGARAAHVALGEVAGRLDIQLCCCSLSGCCWMAAALVEALA